MQIQKQHQLKDQEVCIGYLIKDLSALKIQIIINGKSRLYLQEGNLLLKLTSITP